jgi:hypothetical protein
VLTKDGTFLVLQLLASFHFVMCQGDVSSAFMNGDYYERQEGELFGTLPPEGIPGIPAGSMLRWKKCVYGLGDGPLRWFLAFMKFCIHELGFQQSSFDPCLLYLFHDGRLAGVLGVSVDDVLGGGTSYFQQKCEILKKRFPFGKWKMRRGRYCGKDMVQHDDFSITVEQEYFVDGCTQIEINTARRKDLTSLVTAWELTCGRTSLGNLSYLSRESRPDISGPVAICQGMMPNICVGDLVEINRVASLAHRFRDAKLLILPIPVDQLSLAVFVDAAHQNVGDGSSQAGYLVMVTDRNISKGEVSPVSPVMWKSHKIKRKAAGTIHSEVLAISEGLAAAEYFRCMLLEACHADFAISSPYKLSARCPVLGVTDSKGGFDHLSNPTSGPSKDRRCAVDVAVVRSALKVPGTGLRWVDGAKQQITDVLTKKNGNADLLRAVLKQSEFVITKQDVALAMKQQSKQDRVDRKALRAPKEAPTLIAHSSVTFSDVCVYDIGEDDWLSIEPVYRTKLLDVVDEHT